jgi:hypothetical protein
LRLFTNQFMTCFSSSFDALQSSFFSCTDGYLERKRWNSHKSCGRRILRVIQVGIKPIV